jgi:hypothetical protein
MKTIANLAAEEKVSTSKKRKKGDGELCIVLVSGLS